MIWSSMPFTAPPSHFKTQPSIRVFAAWEAGLFARKRVLTWQWDAHLLFIQKHEAHDHYVDVPAYRAVFEETGDLEGTQRKVATHR